MKKAIAFYWNYFWVMTIQNPKSTFSGLFSGVGLAAAGALEYIPATNKKADFVILIIAAVCKIGVQCISADTGKQLAKVGDEPIHSVASTELPVDPFAKPVTKP